MNIEVQSLHERLAELLNMTVAECQTFSLRALAAFVRPDDPEHCKRCRDKSKLYADVIDCIENGRHIKA